MRTGEGRVDMEGEDTKQRSTIIPQQKVFVPWPKCNLIYIYIFVILRFGNIYTYVYTHMNYSWDVRDSFLSGV